MTLVLHRSIYFGMSENRPDKISILRAKYLDAINVRQSEIKQFQVKLSVLDEVEADTQTVSEPVASGKLKYSGWKITKAIMDALQIIGGNGGVSAPEVRKYIVANGYKHSGAYLNATTNLTLRRLAKTEKIGTAKLGEKRVYMTKR